MGESLKAIGVSGADGFIGRTFCDYVEARNLNTVRLVRGLHGPGRERRVVADLATSDCASMLKDVDVVLHLAGRAHVLGERGSHAARLAFERTNVDGTLRFAEAAARAGVRRFVFVSSIGVNGNRTFGVPFTEDDTPAPVEPYAKSKHKAEMLLKSFAKESSLEVVIVRPPLVYGPGAKGNFARLLRIAASEWPVPLGSLQNRRSLIGVHNLCDFLSVCLEHPAASGETFLIAEPEARSTAEIVREMRKALGRRQQMLPIPVGFLRMCAMAVGRRVEFEKMCGSLEVSSAKAQRLLGWAPKFAFSDEMARAAQWYVEEVCA